jgi:hypothetical protein
MVITDYRALKEYSQKWAESGTLGLQEITDPGCADPAMPFVLFSPFPQVKGVFTFISLPSARNILTPTTIPY